jgi:hypothetical protein
MTMTRRTLHRMVDAVNVAKIPADAAMVAGYVDGHYVTVPALRKRFPGALVVTITVTGNTLDAHVADVEAGDLTPEHGAAWARDKIAAGHHATLYCSESNWPSVRAEVKNLGLPRRRVSYWVASYDNDPTIPRGAVAKQFSTGDYDTSNVGDRWPGVIPAGLSNRTSRLVRRLVRRLDRRDTPLTAVARAQLDRLHAELLRVTKL